MRPGPTFCLYPTPDPSLPRTHADAAAAASRLRDFPPTQRPCPPPAGDQPPPSPATSPADPSHAQSASRSHRPHAASRSRLPHAASRSAVRRGLASALAGDEEPPRRRRRAAPGLQQRAPASRDGDEELRPRPFEIQQRRALAGCPPEEWNRGRRACLMSWRATTALRPPRRPDG